MVVILAFAVSLIPSIAIFLWFRKRGVSRAGYQSACTKALLYGFLSIIPVLAFSAAFVLLGKALGIENAGGVPADLYHTFLVFALSEELAKFLLFKKVLKDCTLAFSWLDAAVLMMIVGIGFGLIEDIPYGLSTNAGQMLVRGVTMMHAAFGIVLGYFCGKAMATGRRGYYIVGFVLAVLLHGLYDFCLSESLPALTGAVSLLIAIASVVIIGLFIRFAKKAEPQEKYMAPVPASLNRAAQPAGPEGSI